LDELADGRDRDAIVPVVKRAEPEGYGNAPPPSMTPDEFPVFEDLTPYLIVGYAFDFPDHFVFVSCPQLKALPGAVMLVVGGEMEASLLLVDHLWPQIEAGLAGGLIAAVPARDILLVTGSEVSGGRERLQRGIETTWPKTRPGSCSPRRCSTATATPGGTEPFSKDWDGQHADNHRGLD
jgi:hypothetical protein